MKPARIVVLGHRPRRRRHRRVARDGRRDPSRRSRRRPRRQLETVDVLVAKADIGMGTGGRRSDVRWQTWPAAAAESKLHQQERPARRHRTARRRDRARAVLRRRADPRSQADQGQGAPATWPRSCRRGMRAVSTESRRKPAPAASSCRTITSTSSCRAATKEAEKTAGVEKSTQRDDPDQHARAGDRPDGRGEERPARRGRQDRDARARRRARPRRSRCRASSARCRSRCAASLDSSNADARRRRRRTARTGINMVRFGVSTQTTTLITAQEGIYMATGDADPHRAGRHDRDCSRRGLPRTGRAAADALIADPRTQPIKVAASDVGSQFVPLGIGKSVVIDLPRDIKDVLVGRSEDRQRGRPLRAPRLHHRRRGRPDQRLLLRRRRPADRRLRHRGDPRPQRPARGDQAGAAGRRHPRRRPRRRHRADGHASRARSKRSRPSIIASRLVGDGTQGRQRHHRARPRPGHAQGHGRRGAARRHQAARHRSQRQRRQRHGGASTSTTPIRSRCSARRWCNSNAITGSCQRRSARRCARWSAPASSARWPSRT